MPDPVNRSPLGKHAWAKILIPCVIIAAALLLGACGAEQAVPAATATPLPTIQLAPVETAPPTPTPTPKPSIGPYFEPTITKHPGGEEVVEGSCIFFSSFADDMLRCEWEFVKDGEVLSRDGIEDAFPGITVAGYDGTYLVLGNVPLELDGWSVRCRFTGSGEAQVVSDEALINVYERKVKLHGIERGTLKGTGNLSGYGATVLFDEGETWWAAEEYASSRFTLMARDIDPNGPVKAAVLEIFEDGSVFLSLGEREYTGTLSDDRVYGFPATAVVSAPDDEASVLLSFDYTARAEKDETWDRITVNIPVNASDLSPEAPADAAAKDAAAAPEAGGIAKEETKDDAASGGADAVQQQEEEAEEGEAEPEVIIVQLTLTRDTSPVQ